MGNMLRFQLSRMVRCREFIAAMLVSALLVCGSFLLSVEGSAGLDRTVMPDASETTCMNGDNYWHIYSAVWPFLVVLPFATSFVEEKKNQCIAPAVSRGSYGAYLKSKLVAAAIGSAAVMFIPLLLNLLACFAVFPSNHNSLRGGYNVMGFDERLLGLNRDYRTVPHSFFLVQLYVCSPFWYAVMYTVICGAFSGLCGMAVTALSFRFSKKKILLFIPLYAFVFVTRAVSTASQNRLWMDNSRFYVNLDITRYLAPLASNDCSYLYFAAVCAGLALLTWGCLRWARKNTLGFVQG